MRVRASETEEKISCNCNCSWKHAMNNLKHILVHVAAAFD